MDKTSDKRAAAKASVEQTVALAVQRKLNEYPYAFAFRKIAWRYHQGRLTLHGSVPSFYLKQLLQELLRGVESVNQIENDVDVVSSNGFSSERAKCTRE